MKSRLFLRTFLAVLLLLTALPAAALEHVTLQLMWQHQFQFAGYYAALEKGYYREAGLDVDLVPAAPNQDAVSPVLAGSAQYGVGNSSLVMLRQQGKPVVVLAVILQHSPLVIIARGGLDNVHALAGKRVMLEAHSEELLAYLKKEGLNPDKLITLPHSGNAAELLAGRVDAMSAYSSDELFDVHQARMPHTVLTPRSEGIDFYGDNLFTSEQEIREHPQRAKAFREASLRGWQYAMSHPGEISRLILSRYGSRHSAVQLAVEAAEMHRLMQPDLVEIGQMHRGRWQHIAETYQYLGMIKDFDLDGFLYDPSPRSNARQLYPWLAGFVAASLILGGLAWYFHFLNGRLRREVSARESAHASLQANLLEIQKLQARLHEQAIRDSLTGLFNRRYLDETLGHELARARREGYALSVVMIDLDHFKAVNDRFGHQAGDEMLKALGRLLREDCREGDIACRYGGEEFVLLLPRLGDPAVRERAEYWRRAFAALVVDIGGGPIGTTLSCGVAVFPEHGLEGEDLIRHADLALYQAKLEGRNRVVVHGVTPAAMGEGSSLTT